jgi:zinc transport system ATP-binding protein
MMNQAKTQRNEGGGPKSRTALPRGKSEPLLKVSGLRVDFGNGPLFEDMNFQLERGRTLVLLGPNGAGKTVLLKALLGLLPLEGQVVWKNGVTVGYVPQRVPLNREIPVTISDFFSLRRNPAEKAADMLREVGIFEKGFLDKPLGVLSSGQFQRVLIAWALARRPDVLLFDEPTAGIDIGGTETIYTLLKRTQKQRSFSLILVTHDLQVVPDLADWVLCMNREKHCQGSPDKMLQPGILRGIYGGEAKFYRHVHD